MLTPNELLAKAADIMSERGMNKGNYEDETTHAVCAYGAMTLVISDGTESNAGMLDCTDETGILYPAAQLLARQINPECAYGGVGTFSLITEYNDNPATSTEDMILSFKRAAGL